MEWNQLYAMRSYVRSSLWIVPFLALLLEQITVHAVAAIDEKIGWSPPWPFGLAGTQAALQAIITLNLSFIVFTFGSILVAIQVASGQLTPRIIATTLLCDKIIRSTVGLFIFALLFAIGTVTRTEASIPNVGVWVAAVLGFISVPVFLFLIDYTARLLRPVSIMCRVGEEGIAVIESIYPNTINATDSPAATRSKLGAPDKVANHTGTSAIVLAVNLNALVAEAQRLDSVIELVPRVGDFVASGEPLFMLHGGASAINGRRLRGTVAFGPERTIDRDATFAFRIIVDIAIKALSQAINDPTTAVLAIDQLQRLIRVVGGRQLHDEQITDSAGRFRVVMRTPDWDDFVQLSFREIRLYGAGNFQIARRLLATIENLLQTLPDVRRPALRQELELLDRAVEASYAFPEDRMVARISDTQGLGGSSVS